MKKIKNALIAAIAIASISLTSAFAGMSFGLTGSMIDLDASGTETDTLTSGGAAVTDTSVRKKSVGKSSGTASIYLEYTSGTSYPVTFGGEYTPGTISLGKFSRADSELSVTGSKITTANAVTRTASASGTNFATVYVEAPIFKYLYARAGMANITVDHSNNSNMSGSTSLSGINLGVGLKGVSGAGTQWKLAYEQTDYDTLNLRSTGNSVAANSTGVKADLDTSAIRFSLGKSF